MQALRRAASHGPFIHPLPDDNASVLSNPPATRVDPSPDLASLADQCVMCGLCLPHCPTYQRDRVESRGPRGRIALIAAINASRDWLTASAATDLDSCLSCLRCQQACPAQVRYGELIDHARNRWRPIKRSARWLFWLSVRPRLLARLTAMARGLRRFLPFNSVRGLEAGTAPLRKNVLPPPAQGRDAPDAIVLAGCSARSLEPRSLLALQQLAALAGLRVDVYDSGCCGALLRHGGALTQGAQLARAHWRRVEGAALAQVPLLGWASGCQQQLQQTAPAGVSTESVWRWTDRVLLPALLRLPIEADNSQRPGLWSPCTLSTQAGASGSLERVLQHFAGTHWHRLQALGCCGAAGIRQLSERGASLVLTDAVLDEAVRAGCTVLLSGNPGCLHALRARAAERGLALPVLHVYDWCLQRLHGQSHSIAASTAASNKE